MKKKIVCFAVLLLMITGHPCSMAFAKTTPKIRKRLVISVGQEKKIKVKNPGNTVKWKSSNKKVATVSKKGIVTGKKRGTVTITAKTAGKKLKCKVFVGTPVYSDKYIKLYYISHNADKMKIAIKSKRKCIGGALIGSISLDGQHFTGQGGASLKPGEHNAFYFEKWGKKTLNEKPHKKVSMIGWIADEKDGDEDQIVKAFNVKGKIIGTKENYTGYKHSEKVAIDNADIKISYKKRTKEGYVFCVTFKGKDPVNIETESFSVNGKKQSDVLSYSSGVGSLMLSSGDTSLMYVSPDKMPKEDKKLEGTVLLEFFNSYKEKRYKFAVDFQ